MLDYVPNYDEALVPEYTLPDPLRLECGELVSDVESWERFRRPEILELFRKHVYGIRPESMPFEVEVVESGDAFDGLGTREQVRLWFTREGVGRRVIDLLIYRPAAASEPVPVFLGLNFKGNHSTTADPVVRKPESWIKEMVEHGTQSPRWPFEALLARGHAVATFFYGDAAPDHAEHWREGFASLFYPERTGNPGPDEPGAIAWWAWALSRALDYLATRSEFDASRVTVVGHSRQGKAALWASAEDPRFAIAISNNSGCTGAAISRRCFGERGLSITKVFPHWFCGNYRSYNDRENELPIDQHQLIALTAPRPVYIASATGDQWADPKGEFLGGVHAGPVFALWGYATGLGTEHPAPDTPIGDRIGYHYRTGKHDITPWDWEEYASFAERWFKEPGL